MKTKFQEIVENNPWILSYLHKKKGFSTNMLMKAKRGQNITFLSKLKIFTSLLEYKVIDIHTTKTLDLFEPLWKQSSK